MSRIKPHAKAIILPLVVAIAAVAEWAGVDVGLDLEHYIGLLAADVLVWLTPNRDERAEAVE